MRTVRLECGKIILDGELVNLSKLSDKSEFLASLMTLDIELAEDIRISDIIHLFYDSKNIIKSILSEEYEVVRTLTTSTILPNEYKFIRAYKSFKIENDGENDFLHMSPELEIVKCLSGEDGVNIISELPFIIDENIYLEYGGVEIKTNTKFTLMDLMIVLFDELPSIIKEGALFYDNDYF